MNEKKLILRMIARIGFEARNNAWRQHIDLGDDRASDICEARAEQCEEICRAIEDGEHLKEGDE